MPKKGGENTKAVEAKARKEGARKAELEKKQKAAEDAYWADDDKHIARKQNRKEEKEKKRLEDLARKTTNKMLAEEEAEAAIPKSHQQPIKITQAQIVAERERREAAARKAAGGETKPRAQSKEAPIEENLNKVLNVDEEARTVDEALKMLSTTDTTPEVDRHPERRLKAAYAAFEEIRLPQVKKENPSLRLSQLKQIIFAEWQKSPDNPMNKEKLLG